MASLTVIAGPNAGDYYPLGQRTIVIGRDEGAAIQITDTRVSRKHLQIRQDGGNYVALDLKSANGTYVNGAKIEADFTLRDGDEIGIGDSTLTFSTRDFTDRGSAFDHWKQVGQKRKMTMQS